MAVVHQNNQMPDDDLRDRLERLYARLNRRQYVSPDPLQFLGDYSEVADREIVGLIASSLAFGNVRQIVRSVAGVLERMPEPARFLDCATRTCLERHFSGFRHRYVTDVELVDLLMGVKGCRETHGSLETAFVAGRGSHGAPVLSALAHFVDELRAYGQLPMNYLLPAPARGSACKRLHLFLRWMVRSDEVDPGGWNRVRPADLIVPLDTHMHRIARALGMTRRRAADMRTALEVTAAFRMLVPEDPIRYDFALTRLGIRRDTIGNEFLRELGRVSRRATVPKLPSST